MVFILIPLLAVIAAGTWRFAPPAAGWTASALVVVLALVVGWRLPQVARAGLPALGLLGALLAALRLIPGETLWPCAVHCQGGGHYHQLAGLNVLWLALAGYALFAVLGLREQHRDRLSPWTAALGWLLIGSSLFYLQISLRLGIVCPHCLAVHTVALAFAGGLLRQLPWQPAVGAVLLALLGLHAAFHPGVVSDAVDVDLAVDTGAGSTALSPANKLAFATADGIRRQGDAAAPMIIELVLDLQCPICARQHHALYTALAPAVADKRIEVVMRQLVRRSEPASQTLGRWTFAAAISGKSTYDFYLGTMLGSRPGADAHELRTRLAEAIDPLILDGIVDRHRAAIDRLLSQDAQRLVELKAPARTPQVIAVDRASGQVLRRWVGELPLDEITTWLGR